MTTYAGLKAIDQDLWAISRQPPAYDLNDNGTAHWPPECHFAAFPEEWPFVAEVWEKFWDEGERWDSRRIRDAIRCRGCGEKLQLRHARRHQGERHVGIGLGPDGDAGVVLMCQAVEFDYLNPLWTWQLLGFEDLWWGRPMGSRNVLDPRDRRVQQWELDALEVGTAAADYLWQSS